MQFYVMNDDLPNWTEVAQVVIGLAGMVAALWTLIKLVSRDKQRESEIASLSMIATQLKDLQLLNEKRHIESKKPQMEIELKRDMHHFLHFKNLNSGCQITQYKKQDLRGFNGGMVSSISNVGREQTFSFSVSNIPEEKPIKLELIYVVEDIYSFKQIVSIHDEGMRKVAKGGIITQIV